MMDKEKSNVIRQGQKPVEVQDSFKNRGSLGYSWSIKYFIEMRGEKKRKSLKKEEEELEDAAAAAAA